MAIIFADGFDHYGTGTTGRANMLAGVWAELSGNNPPEPSVDQKRTGTHSLFMRYTKFGTCNARRIIPGNPRKTLGICYGVYMPSLPSANDKVTTIFRDAANAVIVAFEMQTNGALAIKRGGVTLATSPAATFTAQAFSHVEIKVTVDNVVGAAEVRVNGSPIIVANNLALGTQNISAIGFYCADGAETNYYIDDLLGWDTTGPNNNDFMGMQRVIFGYLGADTAKADWAKVGSATGYGAIAKAAPNGDTSYIQGDAIGDASEFTLAALPPEALDIAGVYIPAMAKLTQGGIGDLRLSMKSGGEIANGPDIPLTTLYTYWPTLFERDPATGGKWTKQSLASALVRVEKTA